MFDNACFIHGVLHFEQVNEAFSVGLTPDKDKRLWAIGQIDVKQAFSIELHVCRHGNIPLTSL